VDEAETREFFQIIDEQADRLRDMVDNLLDLTRIEAGSLSVTTQPASLPEIIEEARASFARNGAPQEVRLQVPEDLPRVNADRRRVSQVLVNLLSNAAKFSPSAAPIEIEIVPDPVHVTVRVRDQGRGVAEEMLPHLFKKFSQVHEDSGSRLAGSGLGLAICKGIVEAHGGRIWAESPGAGQGTTFSFTLPVAPENVAAPAIGTTLDTTQRAEHLGRVRRAGERTRILAVDDEARILRYLERTLEEAGYQAIATSDPAKVARLVELEEPDLLLLDLMMPGTSGFELLRQVREFSGVPVIFVTGRDRDEDTVRALRMGADDYITKPFSPSELLARIEATLRRRVLSDQVEVRPPLVLDGLTINFVQRRVTVNGQPVSLSATEYKILYELASHAGMVLTHGQILQRVWGPEYSGETELVRSFIRNLRRKLGDEARNPRYIFTEPQVGYRMPRP
jgi:DNA-binding response OmpR family regulator/anti-sigma regulatory factor (Ser/Thr protein kinase)